MGAVVADRWSVRTAWIYMSFVAPMLVAAIVLPLIGRLYLATFESTAPAGPAVAAILLEALPALILAWTVFGVISVLSEYGQGRFVSLRASKGLQRAGAGAIVALLLQVVLVPIGLAALREQPLWPALNPNAFDLAMMIFAVGMLAIGGALEAAAREMQSENDQIV